MNIIVSVANENSYAYLGLLSVGISEFLEGWLGLVNRLANTKYLFESIHTLPTTAFVPGHEPFNAAEFMVYVHKVNVLFNILIFLEVKLCLTL